MIPYGRHSISQEDIDSVVAALKSDWLTTGPLVEQFEKTLEKITGANTICVSSGTAALHCAFAAIDLEPGDEVITPPITFMATQATASLLGAKVVFADVRSDNANIDPSAVEAAITNRTRAIVAVDYAGHPADLSELKAIAEKNDVFLIEDAAHSFGSLYKNRPVGSIADLTTFSFFPTKNMTTGEGGAVSSPDPLLLEKARKFARQGLVRNPLEFKVTSEGPWHQEVQQFGLNYRLPDVLCALGISQATKIKKFKERRREIFNLYNSAISQNGRVITPFEEDFVDSNWHLYPIRVQDGRRREVYEYLRQNNVGVQVNYFPAHLHPVFLDQGFGRGNFPRAEAFYDAEISLPMYYGLHDSEVEYVVERLREIT